MIKFEITKKTKKKARKRRQQYERKWLIFRVLKIILFIITILSFIFGVFNILNNLVMIDVCALAFAISLVGYVSVRQLMNNLSSHWIQDRLNKRIWVKDGILKHFVQKAVSAGWHFRRSDLRALIYEYDIATIKDAKYDHKSGRMEFVTDGKAIYYKDYLRETIKNERIFKEKLVVFYDYMKPSLYTYLKEQGVEFKLETLDFKIRDKHV